MKSKIILLFAIIMFSVIGVQAQTVSGTLQGRVTDSNNAVIPNVSVIVKNEETGLTRNLQTNNEGFFNVAFLPIGTYTISATRTDFNKVTRSGITVRLNDTSVVNITLEPTVKGEVTIVAEAPPINTTNQQIAGSLTSQQIQERPVLNQANFLTLAETFTGYQENPTSGQNNPTASSGSSINFNGTGTRGATFQINGVNNDDSSENQNRQGVSLASVKEFQVITNNYTAEFGRGYGAVVLVQTKQGTNNIKGEAYLFHNDSALNANSFFNNLNGVKKPVDRRNQFGMVVGFPIWKDKLFGFLSADHIEDTGAGSFTRDIFTASEKLQANWFLTTPANNTPGNVAFIQSIQARFGNLSPNSPLNARTYAGTQGRDFPARDYSGRFDLNLTEKDNISTRWHYSRQKFQADDVIKGERADQNHHQNNGGLTWTHIFSPQLVGEFRYGLGLRTTLVNITAGNDTPVVRFVGSPVSGSIIGNAGNFPIQRYQTDNQFVYNVSWVLGQNHMIKMGTDIRKQRLDDLADNFSRGFYNFSATCNGTNYGTAYNAFLNGCVTTFQKAYGPFFLKNRIGESNFYAEDNWKVTKNLTLNIGYRYEYVNSPKEVDDKINYVYKNDSNNHEPRVGFAWAPDFSSGFLNKMFGNSGDFSVRGGYGIYHGRLFQTVFSQGGASVRFNPPNAILLSFSNRTNLADPTNGFVFTPAAVTTRHTEALIDPGLEMPYTQQWNLTFERQLPWKTALRATYSGNRGIGLLRFSQYNLPIHNPNGVVVTNHPNNAPTVLYSGLPAADPRMVDVRGQTLRPAANILCAGTGLTGIAVNATCPVAVPLLPNEYSLRVPRLNERRPNGLLTTSTEVSNSSWSYYHGLQVELQKKLSDGLTFQGSYTWSKSIDTTSEATALGAGDSNQNGNSSRLTRGNSRFHTPHRFTLWGTYRIPFLSKRKDILGQVFGGWQATMVMKWVHGTPFTISNSGGVDLNFDGFAESRPVLLDPNLIGRTIGHRDSAQNQLPRTGFRSATLADFGCCVLGRNNFYIDGVKNFDIAFQKNFLMPWEGHRLNLRADMFNAFNHVQFGIPNTDIASSSFGAITGTAFQYTPRRIQISLRYSF